MSAYFKPEIPNRGRLQPQAVLAVGFGACHATKDNAEVYNEQNVEDEAFLTAGDIEAMALLDPEHDWRISFYGPMRSQVYQRQGAGIWLLIYEDMGFV